MINAPTMIKAPTTRPCWVSVLFNPQMFYGGNPISMLEGVCFLLSQQGPQHTCAASSSFILVSEGLRSAWIENVSAEHHHTRDGKN